MISVNNIYKSYDNLPVLKGIDLQVKKEEIVCLMGASGAGKSTLLHIMGTLDRPDKGQIIIEDKDVFTLSKKELAAFRGHRLGFVFQFHHLLPEFTALENVSLPALINGKSKKEAKKEAMKLLEQFNLQQRSDHKPNELSGGEQQRVAIARALINNPSVIFADEPSGNLDSKNADELHQFIVQLRNSFHQTFVIVTHSKSLMAIADRTLEIKDGKIT